jgi:hypothetical protein
LDHSNWTYRSFVFPFFTTDLHNSCRVVNRKTFGSKNRRAEQIRSCLGWGVGIPVGKGCKKVNAVQILCTHVCKWKNDTCWNYSRNVEEGV